MGDLNNSVIISTYRRSHTTFKDQLENPLLQWLPQPSRNGLCIKNRGTNMNKNHSYWVGNIYKFMGKQERVVMLVLQIVTHDSDARQEPSRWLSAAVSIHLWIVPHHNSTKVALPQSGAHNFLATIAWDSYPSRESKTTYHCALQTLARRHILAGAIMADCSHIANFRVHVQTQLRSLCTDVDLQVFFLAM